MKLTAIDTLHISSVKAENLMAGEEFEIDDAAGESLLKRGLALKAKAELAPKNKAVTPASNKAS